VIGIGGRGHAPPRVHTLLAVHQVAAPGAPTANHGAHATAHQAHTAERASQPAPP
jgi:hypothetical protein